MQIFTFVWRVESNGDFFEQGFAAASLKQAKARWRHYWALRMRDCVHFEVIG